jgi:hypothetical protein
MEISWRFVEIGYPPYPVSDENEDQAVAILRAAPDILRGALFTAMYHGLPLPSAIAE